MNFIRFLHLIAHHPDFAVSEESLPDIAKSVPYLSTYALPLISVQRQVHWILP